MRQAISILIVAALLLALSACEPPQPDDPPIPPPPVEQLPDPPPIEEGALPDDQPRLPLDETPYPFGELPEDTPPIPTARLEYLFDRLTAKLEQSEEQYRRLDLQYGILEARRELTRRGREHFAAIRDFAIEVHDEQRVFLRSHRHLADRPEPALTGEEALAVATDARRLAALHMELRILHENLAGIHFDDDRPDLVEVHNRFAALHREQEKLSTRLSLPDDHLSRLFADHPPPF